MKKNLLFLILLIFCCAFTFARSGREAAPEDEGSAMARGEYGEAPMLAALVAKGELPSVEERLPDEPAVIEPYEEIGTYGGTMTVFATNENPWNDMQTGAGISQGLIKLADDGVTIEGNIVEGYEIADDKMSFTLFLREGLKWSDGMPFTAADIKFFIDDVQNNEEVQSWNVLWKVMRAIEVDDYTARLELNVPDVEQLIFDMYGAAAWSWFAFQPKHYLSKWHIAHNPDADKVAKEEGYDTWMDALNFHMWWAPQKDTELPTLNPWYLAQTESTHKLFERNPYYWRVDTAGNQLPYINQILAQIVDGEAYNLKVVSGEADIAYVGTSFENYTLYKESESTGNYRVVMMENGQGAIPLSVNLTHPDPVLRDIYSNLKFRQALSHAIDRDEINNVVYNGLGLARNCLVNPNAPYYKPEWGEASAQYDPEKANRLLDEVGLSKLDRDGFRMRPDGKTLLLLVEYQADQTKDSVLELVREFWEDVGLKTVIKGYEPGLFGERRDSNEHDVIAGNLGPYPVWVGAAGNYQGSGGDFAYAPAWGTWLSAKQAQVQKEIGEDQALPENWRDMETHEEEPLPGEEPPPEWKEVNAWAQQISGIVLGKPGYNELAQKIYDFHAENLYVLSMVDMIPKPLIAKNNLHNIPPSVPHGMFAATAITWVPDTFFFKE